MFIWVFHWWHPYQKKPVYTIDQNNFPLPYSCQNQSCHWEPNLFCELIYHHYPQNKLWNQSKFGNFIDAQSRTEPRSPWISRIRFALLTTNMSLTKLTKKRWLGKFSAEGNLSVTEAGYFYPYNSMLMKLVRIMSDWKCVPQGAESPGVGSVSKSFFSI